jgi:hypothetical protein
LPEIITAVPPEVGPLLGATPEIVGEEEAATLEVFATPRQPAKTTAINTSVIVKRIIDDEGECIHFWCG